MCMCIIPCCALCRYIGFASDKNQCVCVCAQVEFFGPLCDLVEGSLKVDVTTVDVSNQVDVPSLAELCVRNIHKAKLGL